MKIATAAAALLLAAVAPHGVQATGNKTPVDPDCPLVINVPSSNQFVQAKGGYIIVSVQNPSGAAVSGVTVSYNLGDTMVDSGDFPNGGLIALAPGTGTGVRKRGKSSRGAPAPQITNGGRIVTYTGLTVGGTLSSHDTMDHGSQPRLFHQLYHPLHATSPTQPRRR